MEEINVKNLGIWDNELIVYKDSELLPGQGLPKKLNQWWGKTFYIYDNKSGKFYIDTLNLIGIFLHKFFNYRSDLNRENGWKFFKAAGLVTSNDVCPSQEKCKEVFETKLLNFAKKRDEVRNYFQLDWGPNKASQEEKIDYLKNHEIDPNDVGDVKGSLQQISLLYRAAEADELEVVKYLVEKGDAQINTPYPHPGQYLYRPLDFAAFRGNEEMFKLFLNHDADVNAIGFKGRTAIFYLLGAEAHNSSVREISDKEKNKRMLSDILAKNPNINITDHYGRSPLSYAIESEDLESVMTLIANGADINLASSWDVSPLHFATAKNNLALIDILQNRRPNVGANAEQRSAPIEVPTAIQQPVEAAPRRENAVPTSRAVPPAVQRRVEATPRRENIAPARVVASPTNYRPIDFANHIENEEMFNMLLNNVDVNAVDLDGRTPIFYVLGVVPVNRNTQNAYEQDRGLVNPYISSITNSEKRQRMLVAMLEKNPNLDILDNLGRSPLSYAIESEDLFSIEQLLAKRANVNLAKYDYHFPNLPLYFAITKKNLSLVNTLFEHQAHINNREMEFLAWALGRSTVQIMDKMLQHGFNIDTYGINSMTTLHWAVMFGNVELVRYLLSKNASRTIKTNPFNLIPSDLINKHEGQKLRQLRELFFP